MNKKYIIKYNESILEDKNENEFIYLNYGDRIVFEMKYSTYHLFLIEDNEWNSKTLNEYLVLLKSEENKKYVLHTLFYELISEYISILRNNKIKILINE